MAVTPIYQQLITDLIDGYVGPDTSGEELRYDNYFDSTTYKDELNSAKFKLWKNLIDYLGGQQNPIPGFDNQNSLFAYIANKIDLVNALPPSYWNQSVKDAIDLFNNKFNGNIDLGNGQIITTTDIKDADAGYSFSDTPWVKPNINIDGETYDDVRGADAITSVLKDDNELQFTHEGVYDWIRLLMPKYLRTVEVEDLNRNFWVIGQVTSALCAFLFGDNGLADLLDSLLKEIVGLWENVLFLWVASALMAQRKTTNIHCEVVIIPNDSFNTNRKFDYFWHESAYQDGYNTSFDLLDNDAENIIKSRLAYLKDMYPESNLIIVPEIRENNYKHNYYATVNYPGVYTFDRENNIEAFHWFICQEDQTPILPLPGNGDKEKWLKLDLKHDSENYIQGQTTNYLEKIWGIREEETKYSGYYSYANTLDASQVTDTFYGLIRSIPTCEIVNDKPSITFEFIDAAGVAVRDNNNRLFEYTIGDTVTIEDIFKTQITTINLYGQSYYGNKPNPVSTIDQFDIIKGYYMGELISYMNVISNQNINYTGQSYWGTPMPTLGLNDIVGELEQNGGE